MKLAHCSDLHIGRRINGISLEEEQRDMFAQFTAMMEKERPDAILLAGDIYDVSNPSSDAVAMADELLSDLAALGIPVYMIYGNHDMPQRVAYGAKLLAKTGVHIAPVFDGTLCRYTLTDEKGELDLYLLPFIRPAVVSSLYEERCDGQTAAFKAVLQHNPIDYSRRCVLMCHQFVYPSGSKPELSGSESILSVGTIPGIEASEFAGFDYVAMGHIHKPQTFTYENTIFRYCGTPYPYAFPEGEREHGVTFVEIGGKGEVEITVKPLKPLRDLVTLRGTLEEILALADDHENYIHVVLTDEHSKANLSDMLQSKFSHLVSIQIEAAQFHADGISGLSQSDVRSLSPYELFEQFYEQMTGKEPSEIITKTAKELLEGDDK